MYIENYIKKHKIKVIYNNYINDEAEGEYYFDEDRNIEVDTEEVIKIYKSKRNIHSDFILVHELIHSTGNQTRLNRESLYNSDKSNKEFVIEELIADTTTVMVFNDYIHEYNNYLNTLNNNYFNINQLNNNEINYIINNIVKSYNYFTDSDKGEIILDFLIQYNFVGNPLFPTLPHLYPLLTIN